MGGSVYQDVNSYQTDTWIQHNSNCNQIPAFDFLIDSERLKIYKTM